MTDCLLIGHNEGHFPDYVSLIKSWGTWTGFWRKLNLCFIDIEGVPHHAMDVINRYNLRDGQRIPKLSNMDFLWPAVSYLASYVARRGFTGRLGESVSGGEVAACRKASAGKHHGGGGDDNAVPFTMAGRGSGEVHSTIQPIG